MNGDKQYPYFWSSTTHLDGNNPYSSAVYVAFGEAQGVMDGKLMDVHGAGAQRSDPKVGKRRTILLLLARRVTSAWFITMYGVSEL